MLQKEFTRQAERVLDIAKTYAKKWNHPYIGTEHVLLALKKEFTGVGAQVLEMNGVEEAKIIQLIEELTATRSATKKKLEFSPRLEF